VLDWVVSKLGQLYSKVLDWAENRMGQPLGKVLDWAVVDWDGCTVRC